MTKRAIIFMGPVLALVSACAATGGSADAGKGSVNPSAGATLQASDGSMRGRARVVEAADGLHVTVRASGMTPGLHAVHVHTTGSCTPPDFASAGGHWNPTGRHHGKDNPDGMHMGDMPNILVGSDGKGELDYVISGGRLLGGATPMLDADGAAIVIHAQADDNKSDPAGNAGGRMACGVLTPS